MLLLCTCCLCRLQNAGAAGQPSPLHVREPALRGQPQAEPGAVRAAHAAVLLREAHGAPRVHPRRRGEYAINHGVYWFKRQPASFPVSKQVIRFHELPAETMQRAS